MKHKILTFVKLEAQKFFTFTLKKMIKLVADKMSIYHTAALRSERRLARLFLSA